MLSYKFLRVSQTVVIAPLFHQPFETRLDIAQGFLHVLADFSIPLAPDNWWNPIRTSMRN
jgi:hypothetical protein